MKTEAVRCHANTLCWHPGTPATVSFDKYWQVIRPFSVFLHQLNLDPGTNLLGKTRVRSTEGKSFRCIQYVVFFYVGDRGKGIKPTCTRFYY